MAQWNLVTGNRHRSQFFSHGSLVGVLENGRLVGFRTLLTVIALLCFGTEPRYAGFVTAPSYAAGVRPDSMAVGDFNGDGHPDLAVASFGINGSSVSVLLGKGDGTFQAAKNYPVAGDRAFSVAVGDFNGDGHLDLAVVSTDRFAAGTVSILLGNGDGTFEAAQNYSAGTYSQSVAVGDFNGDGILDLAVANAGCPNLNKFTGDVRILLGNGDGTFRAANSYATGLVATFVTVGDFNGDGTLDLAVLASSAFVTPHTVSILLGNGDGSFQAAQEYTVGQVPASVAVGDFNGDGHLDLAVANNGSGSVSILLGNGDGTFNSAGSLPAALARSVAVGDFNGDGLADLAVAGPPGVIIFFGTGDGTFLPAQSYAASGSASWVAVGDFNGDGVPDLAAACGYTSACILLGKGDGTFRAAQRYGSGRGGQFVAVGDFNGDGVLDVVVASQGFYDEIKGTVAVLLGNGDGTFHSDGVRYDAGFGPNSVAVGDFNGDGRLDIVTTNFVAIGTRHGPDHIIEADVRVFLGNGDGTFQPARVYKAGPQPVSVAVGDFNGDGIPDLAVANGGVSGVSILLGNGDGTFQDPRSHAAGLTPLSVAVGDFNGDGVLDLAVANQGTVPDWSGTVSILLGKGDGTFRAARSYDTGTFSRSLAVGDFNGDGILDLVVANAGVYADYGTVSVLLGNGDGTFQAAKNYATEGNSASSVVVADLNGDGILDLAVANAGPSNGTVAGNTAVSVLLGTGDGTFQAAQIYAAGGSPLSLALGDFNGDGYLDLAVGNYADVLNDLPQGPVTILLNDANWGP